MPAEYRLVVNGRPLTTHTDGQRPLLDVLREDFHLTGTKYGCGEGECGACTVLVGGVPTRACITSVADIGTDEVQTIEGIAQGDELHPVQQAFLEQEAMQCGYCIPGHIMTAVAFVQDNPVASQAEIVETMSQHICRCCNYSRILTAVASVVGRVGITSEGSSNE